MKAFNRLSISQGKGLIFRIMIMGATINDVMGGEEN